MTDAETADPTPDKFNFLELAPSDPRNTSRVIVMISHHHAPAQPSPPAGPAPATPEPEAG